MRHINYVVLFLIQKIREMVCNIDFNWHMVGTQSPLVLCCEALSEPFVGRPGTECLCCSCIAGGCLLCQTLGFVSALDLLPAPRLG